MIGQFVMGFFSVFGCWQSSGDKWAQKWWSVHLGVWCA